MTSADRLLFARQLRCLSRQNYARAQDRLTPLARRRLRQEMAKPFRCIARKLDSDQRLTRPDLLMEI